MTIDQAVQSSYMAPNAFNLMSVSNLKILTNNVKTKLISIENNCPQSQKRDRVIYQYKYTIKVINRFIN